MSKKLELPKTPQPVRAIMCEVDLDLFKKAEKHMKERDLKIKQAVEFGLKAFILSCEKGV